MKGKKEEFPWAGGVWNAPLRSTSVHGLVVVELRASIFGATRRIAVDDERLQVEGNRPLPISNRSSFGDGQVSRQIDLTLGGRERLLLHEFAVDEKTGKERENCLCNLHCQECSC